jgi:hypothetical protein
MAEKTVRARFELDDHASKTLEHIKEGFEHVAEKAVDTGREVGNVFRTAIGTALGFQLSGMIETIKGIGEEVFEAASGMGAMEKSIRGVLMMTDKEGTSLEEMTTQAHALNESFTEMAVETGASKEAIIGAFDEMAERTGMSTENVEKLTREMTQAGRGVQGGVGALSEGFSNLSSGIIRARNPIVQLITATGVLHGNAKQVAAQLLKMSPAQAMQAGVAAIEKMSGKMKDVPLSFGEMTASMKTLREEIFESLGMPVVTALKEPLGELRDYFRENKETVLEWAKAVGHDAGEWLKEAGEKAREGFEYLHDHAAEIKDDIMEAMRFVRDTVEFIIDHREALAIAWGASKVPGVIGGAIGAAKGVGALGGTALGFGKMLAGVGGAAVPVAAEAAAGGEAAVAAGTAAAVEAPLVAGGASVFGVGLGAGVGAAVAGLGAFAAAIGGVGLAVYQGIKLWDEAVTHNDTVLDMQARKRAAEAAAMEGDVDQVALLTKALYDAGQATDDYIANIRNLAHEQRQAAAIAADEAERVKPLAKPFSMVPEDAYAAPAEKDKGVAYAAPAEKDKGVVVGHGDVYISGGVHIQQDFKDTDPDRVAVIFEQHLAKNARAKAMAATSTAHTAF